VDAETGTRGQDGKGAGTRSDGGLDGEEPRRLERGR